MSDTYTKNNWDDIAPPDIKAKLDLQEIGIKRANDERDKESTPGRTMVEAPTVAAQRTALDVDSKAETSYGLARNLSGIGPLKIKPKNLFNKNTVTNGHYWNYSTGALSANEDYFASDYIPVTPGQVLIKNNLVQLAFFDVDKTFVSGLGTFDAMVSFTVPANVYFLGVSGLLVDIDTFQVEEGETCTPHEAYVEDVLDLVKEHVFVAGNESKNLFNKNTIIAGHYWHHVTGVLTANAAYFASDYIPVTPGKAYIKGEKNLPYSDATELAFFDINKKFISGLDSGTITFAAPAGAAYVGVSCINEYIDLFQVVEGSVLLDYMAYGEKRITADQIDAGAGVTKTVNSIMSKLVLASKTNLFNKYTITAGHYWNYNTGALSVNENYFASDYIPVTPGQAYIKNNEVQLAFFDSAKAFLSGLGSGTTSFAAPTGAAYVGISGLNEESDTLRLVLGTSLTGAIKVKLIGDSITHGVGGTGWAQDGAAIMTLSGTTWYINTSGICWANSLKAYFEEKFDCEVLNYGCTGTNSDHIVAGLSQLIDGTEDIVICMIGTNDRSNNTKQTFYDNLVTIYNYCNALGIDIIFMSNVPAGVDQESLPGEVYHMEDVDHIVMKVSSDLGQEYVSVYKLLIDYCQNTGVTIDSLLNADGLHPNDSGYAAMYYLICNALGFGTKRPGATW